MKEIATLFITAIIVSLDSFVAGFSLSLNKKANLTLPSAVALITLLLCAATTFMGRYFVALFEDYANVLGAVMLTLLAIINLLKQEERQFTLQNVTIGESLVIGMAVGMDASIANLTLATGSTAFVAPIVFAVTHYFTVLLGQILARKIAIPKSNVFSAVILFALAITKIV